MGGSSLDITGIKTDIISECVYIYVSPAMLSISHLVESLVYIRDLQLKRT